MSIERDEIAARFYAAHQAYHADKDDKRSLVGFVADFVLSERAHQKEADPGELHTALTASGLEYSALSWGGFNLYGDRKSIDKAKYLAECEDRMHALERIIKSEREACTRQFAEPSAEMVERVARAYAALKCGVADPTGANLPDDIWRQGIPAARAAISAMGGV